MSSDPVEEAKAPEAPDAAEPKRGAVRGGWATASKADVVVVGGGFSGLLAARKAAREGLSVVVLEASDQVGGRLAPVALAGIELDAGAESFATRGGTVEALVAELGLFDDVVAPSPSPAWVVAPGEAYALPTTSWLGIPSDPMAPEVRGVLGLWGSLRAAWDLIAPAKQPPEGATLGQVARARLGKPATERLIAPVVTGVYTRPIDKITLESMAPGLSAEVGAGGLIRAARARRAAAPPGSAVRSIKGGLFRLVQALADDARAAGVQIRTGAHVEGVERSDDGWRVTTERGMVKAHRLVMAVPRDIAAPMVGIRGGGKARTVAIAVLVVEAPELDAAPRGTGALVRPGVTRAKALTHASAKWEWIAEALPAGTHALRLSYDVDGDPGDLTDDALADASAILGVTLTRDGLVASSQHVWADAAPAAFDRDLVPDGVSFVGAAAGLTGLAAIVGDMAHLDFS